MDPASALEHKVDLGSPPQIRYGTGDSHIVHDLLADSDPNTFFQNVFEEVTWQHMYHASGPVPRLVACQGSIDPQTGSMPVYRHPSDHTLPLLHWTPTVMKIKTEAERRVGHDLNHVLIQLYRSGQDFISEHSDKTLDIAHGSNIVNVSLGAQRMMRLRTKKVTEGATRELQQIPLPHNSMFVMGLDTNKTYLHSIKADKRRDAERDPAELAFGGVRISLTFRRLATFISHDSRRIWGQGATGKLESQARETVNGDAEQSAAMIRAFGIENHEAYFDWEKEYGQGFDVLHLQAVDAERPILFMSDLDDGLRDVLGHSVEYIESPIGDRQPVYKATDRMHTIVRGKDNILAYHNTS